MSGENQVKIEPNAEAEMDAVEKQVELLEKRVNGINAKVDRCVEEKHCEEYRSALVRRIDRLGEKIELMQGSLLEIRITLARQFYTLLVLLILVGFVSLGDGILRLLPFLK